ncbi:MAG TPA: hypothetical protein VLT83_00450 [Opitutaceae bacterium]|nr:hypothetical protein [Opitutaceae bacterium]
MNDHANPPPARKGALAPALTLMVMAPLLAEVLPGATRLSALFVLPIEICMWGGGALLIREAIRRWGLGWRNMLLLALALALAEECVVQQTSLAPMVVQIKGVAYARALGVNYVYFLWALVYEAVFVVFLPVALVELLFPRRRNDPWLGPVGVTVVAAFLGLGAFLAWFSWTRIARPKVFHVPLYSPPPVALALALLAIGGLAYAALGGMRHRLARASAPLTPPPACLAGLAGALWAALWYGLVLLGFGIAPTFPPAAAVGGGLLLSAAAAVLVSRWAAHPAWRRGHSCAVICGTMIGAMLVSFLGFIGALRMDLYFKIAVDLAAAGGMIVLAERVRSPADSPIGSTSSQP